MKSFLRRLTKHQAIVKKAQVARNRSLVGTIFKYQDQACKVVDVSHECLIVRRLVRWNGQRPAIWRLYSHYTNSEIYYTSFDKSDFDNIEIFNQHDIDAGLDEWAKDDWPHASIVRLMAA